MIGDRRDFWIHALPGERGGFPKSGCPRHRLQAGWFSRLEARGVVGTFAAALMRKFRVPLSLAFTLSVAAFAAAPAGEVRRPNILFVLADNWGWPHAGALGDPLAQTPVFDRIAREGVVFRKIGRAHV